MAKGGYIAVRVPLEHPEFRANGYALEHRIIASEKISRPLRRGEIAHHINGDRIDNRPENIQVLGGIADHNRAHPDKVKNWLQSGSEARWAKYRSGPEMESREKARNLILQYIEASEHGDAGFPPATTRSLSFFIGETFRATYNLLLWLERTMQVERRRKVLPRGQTLWARRTET